MAAPTITLCYRKIIDHNAVKPWDKMVFDSSYLEFRIQAQKISTAADAATYAALLQKFPAAQNLSARVMPAISGYVEQLGSIVPDLLNNIGKRFLKFDSYGLEIINSDVNDKTKHQVAINFLTEHLVWHNTVGNHMLLSVATAETNENGALETNLFQLQPYVNINTLKP